MRKVTASIIFILVIVSFFYQYKYGSYLHSNEQKPEVAVNHELSDVTPKPEVPESAQKPDENKDLFAIRENDILVGNRDAKVIVVEVSSLTCPHCSYFHKEVYPELKKKYIDSGKIAYVIREFVSNKQDLDGAILARCLDSKDDPMKLLNILYAQQDVWAFNKNYKELLENIGQLAGISNEKYAECLARSDWVEMLANNSRAMTFFKDFVGTPAFYINGKMHKGIYDVASLSKAIDNALHQNDISDSGAK